jgi:HAD superfamily hydrolase (TIGR01509 family)
MLFKGLIFDMDGTLTVPTIDFMQVRNELGIERGNDLVKVIESWPQEKRDWAWKVIERHEEEAEIKLQPGVKDTLHNFRKAGLHLGILTRNSLKSAKKVLRILQFDFDEILTREHTHIKPDPEAVRHFIRKWAVLPEELIVIGDYIHDIECGKAAGTHTCFFENAEAYQSFSEHADYTAKSFAELESIVLA